MLARMMWRRLGVAGLLVGLGLITAACGVSAPTHAATSPTLIPALSPTATRTISPTATATSVTIVGCSAPSSDTMYHFETPPGPLPTTIPLPPGTLVGNSGLGIQAGSVDYAFCSPTMTPAAIMAFMDSALPAAGWMKNSVSACNMLSYPWYKGNFGMQIDVNGNSAQPYVWSIQLCPHVGQ